MKRFAGACGLNLCAGCALFYRNPGRLRRRPDDRKYGAVLDDAVITSAVITSKVKAALFRDPDVSSFDVRVETYKGRVQLSGFVDMPGQRAQAAAQARGVSGVSSVTNNLIVRSR